MRLATACAGSLMIGHDCCPQRCQWLGQSDMKRARLSAIAGDVGASSEWFRRQDATVISGKLIQSHHATPGRWQATPKLLVAI
jgi:hypothetical protein